MKSVTWWILIGAAASLAAGVSGVVYFLNQRESAWTTRSKAALEELEKGIDATQRGYQRAAVEHLDRALELDPRFVAPRLFLARLYPPWRLEYGKVVAELAEADLESLRPRERYLVRYYLAEKDAKEEAEAALDALLAEYPDDFLGLDIRCERTWLAEDWDRAEACYEKMAALHTNYVDAYNRLGHIDMAQGRFTEAEVHFRTHLFIAPDQALPHTALAELLILLGRYDEARELLAKALEIETDSCWAQVQMIRASNFSRRLDESRRLIDHMETVGECSAFADEGFFCYARGLVDFLAGDFASSWARFEPDCLERRGGFDLIGHHAAIAAGHPEAAREMLGRLRVRLADAEVRRSSWDFDWLRSLESHFQGVESMAAGDYPAASGFLREADGRLRYWTHERGGFKLLNRTFLARSLELEGKREEARSTLAMVEAVNPEFPGHLPPVPFLEGHQP